MIGMGRVTTHWFLDRPRAQRLLKPAEHRFLMRGGAMVMREARQSIRQLGAARPRPQQRAARVRWWREVRERPASPPGRPPYTHTGLLRTSILFCLEPARRDVVIGPAAEFIDDVGALHEFGGRRFGKRYPPRPYMRPALTRILPQLPQIWRNVIV